jgi:hypothetical protein
VFNKHLFYEDSNTAIGSFEMCRGFGAECVSILVADAPVGETAGANTQLAELDLLNLMGSVDPRLAGHPH